MLVSALSSLSASSGGSKYLLIRESQIAVNADQNGAGRRPHCLLADYRKGPRRGRFVLDAVIYDGVFTWCERLLWQHLDITGSGLVERYRDDLLLDIARDAALDDEQHPLIAA